MVPISREQLLHLLAEAAELEHNLLCSYLFALFTLKADIEEDLTAQEWEAVERWRKMLLGVCIEEMIHLAQVANLTVALGSRPHFNRPNLPVAAGYHPAAIVVELSRFDLDTLNHFLFLERPEGQRLTDGASFIPPVPYARHPAQPGLTPASPDYETIGEFYGALRQGLIAYANEFGERALFTGPITVQLHPEEAGSATLRVVDGLEAALAGIDEIVRQGEGSPAEADNSHYTQFLNIKKEYETLLAARPAFDPSRCVGRNPVMKFPVSPGRTHVTEPGAFSVMDCANSLYALMLRCLGQCYETPRSDAAARDGVVQAAFGTMHVLAGLAAALTSMPAHPGPDSPMAGLSFSVPRSLDGPAHGVQGMRGLKERVAEIRAHVDTLPISKRLKQSTDRGLARVGDAMGRGT